MKEHWRSYWPDADVDAMAVDVEARVARAAAAWGLDGLAPLPGGNVAVVYAAGDRVLKVHPRGHADDAHLAAEGVALEFWRETGAAVRVLERRDDGFTLLLEALRPGVPLDDAGLPWEERVAVLAGLVARLHAAGPPPALPRLSDYARDWRRTFAGDADLAAELEALLAPSPDDVLLHADLHGGNALLHGGAWTVIDPHAVVGDRNADVWALIDPLAPVAGPADVERYARLAGLDPHRAAAWTRLRALGEALSPGCDPEWAARLRATAAALARRSRTTAGPRGARGG